MESSAGFTGAHSCSYSQMVAQLGLNGLGWIHMSGGWFIGSCLGAWVLFGMVSPTS